MEDINNSNVNGDSILDEKLAALYDFLTEEGFCPECIENEFISFSYYGTNFKIWCPSEEDGDLYEIFHIANASMKILKNVSSMKSN